MAQTCETDFTECSLTLETSLERLENFQVKDVIPGVKQRCERKCTFISINMQLSALHESHLQAQAFILYKENITPDHLMTTL